jgi:hypothetical protein
MQKLGFSGDSLEIQGKFIIKTCLTDRNRFLKNIEKQKTFTNEHIKSVSVLQEGIIDNKNFIKMQFLKCENPLEWLAKTNTENINKLTNVLLNYFNSILHKSIIKDFDYNIWINKIIDVNNKIYDIELKNILNTLKTKTFKNKFYYGNSHGDFNFSNLFITEENNDINIYAIDFLDTFIHSPINDIIKLRQDLKHLWTLQHLDNSNIDKNTIIIILNHIDNKITSMINNDIILSEYYNHFQILNLMRIIPYINEQITFDYLKTEIKELAKCIQL